MCTMRALVAICVCMVLLVTGNSALPYHNTDYEDFLRVRYMQLQEDKKCPIDGKARRVQQDNCDDPEGDCPSGLNNDVFTNSRYFGINRPGISVELACIRDEPEINLSFGCCDGFTFVIAVNGMLELPGRRLINYKCNNNANGFQQDLTSKGQPSCITDCEQDLGPVNNGVPVYRFQGESENIPANQTLPPGSTAHVECNTGYEPSGQSDVTCQINQSTERSEWVGELPTCEPQGCPDLQEDVTYSHSRNNAGRRPEGSTATYTCPDGYRGTLVRTCQSDGTWSGDVTDLNCVLIECPRDLSGGDNFDVVYDPQSGDLTPGSTARFICQSGHRQVPESPDEVVCQEDGTWDRRQPSSLCQPEGCPLLTDRPINGNIKYTPASVASTLPVGTTATYECGGNFIPVPSNFIRTCQRDGTWSGGPVSVTCQTACPRLSGTIQNGFIQPPNNRDVIRDGRGVILGWRVNSVAQYDCNPGFELVTKNGIKARICQRDGTWTPITAFCRAISTECPRLGKNVALGDDNRYTKQIKTLIKAGYGTKTTQPFATRTEFTGYQDGDRYTLTCVNGWNRLSGSGFEECQRNENTGLMEWSRTNVCFFRYAGGSLDARPIRE